MASFVAGVEGMATGFQISSGFGFAEYFDSYCLFATAVDFVAVVAAAAVVAGESFEFVVECVDVADQGLVAGFESVADNPEPVPE